MNFQVVRPEPVETPPITVVIELTIKEANSLRRELGEYTGNGLTYDLYSNLYDKIAEEGLLDT